MSKFHSAGEDRSRNKRRAHAQPCSYTGKTNGDRVRTRDSGLKRGELCSLSLSLCACVCVWGRARAQTQTGQISMWTICENVAATAPATAATLRFGLFMPSKIFHASR